MDAPRSEGTDDTEQEKDKINIMAVKICPMGGVAPKTR